MMANAQAFRNDAVMMFPNDAVSFFEPSRPVKRGADPYLAITMLVARSCEQMATRRSNNRFANYAYPSRCIAVKIMATRHGRL